MAARANGVYRADITYGDVPMRQGHWSDRLGGIDKDLAAMQTKLQTPSTLGASAQNIEGAIRAAAGKPNRPAVHCTHMPPASFHPGQPLLLSLVVPAVHDAPTAVHLYYRHVNQGKRWLSLEMEPRPDGYSASIPGDYTQSVYPLQYYFALQRGADAAWLYPAFNSTLSNQPYYAVAKRS